MSDSEGSSVRSVLDSEKFEAEKSEEGSEPVPTWQNHPCDEKKGEFEKLLQSMMDSRESSQEEAEKEENEVDEKNTIGKYFIRTSNTNELFLQHTKRIDLYLSQLEKMKEK